MKKDKRKDRQDARNNTGCFPFKIGLRTLTQTKQAQITLKRKPPLKHKIIDILDDEDV